MSDFINKIRDTLDDIEKTETVWNYWSDENSQNRQRNERIIREYDRKGDVLVINGLIMWICMIITTIACWICFDMIVGWFQINSRLIAYFVVLGINAAINLVIAGVISIFRH